MTDDDDAILAVVVVVVAVNGKVLLSSPRTPSPANITCSRRRPSDAAEADSAAALLLLVRCRIDETATKRRFHSDTIIRCIILRERLIVSTVEDVNLV